MQTPLVLAGAAMALFFAAPPRAQATWVRKPILWGPFEHRMVFDGARGRAVLIEATSSNATRANEVWAWNGRTWTLHPSGTLRAGRRHHSLAYDAASRRVVLFGGEARGLAHDDTWLWDGTSWSEASPSTRPPARWGHVTAYDPVRGRVVLFGGRDASCTACFDDTWEWDGSDWVERQVAVRPPPRSFFGMTWDGARQRVVLFGGTAPGGSSHRDTWEWDGTAWTQRAPATSPPAFFGPAISMGEGDAGRVLVYATQQTWAWDGTTWRQLATSEAPELTRPGLVRDPSRGVTVLCGDGAMTDTWEWSGVDWVRVPGPVLPRRRKDHGMAHHLGAGEIVVFGGTSNEGRDLGDTWTWDGLRWSEVSPAASPAARFGVAMAQLGDAVLLFGGASQQQPALDDTWLWTGASWTQLAPATRPSARLGHALAYDAGRNRVVLFGGAPSSTGNPFGDTWEWANGQWTRSNPSPAPLARTNHAMAYDAARGRVVLFGGDARDGTDHRSDTWEWDGTAWTERSPIYVPPAREGHAMAYDEARGRVVMFGGWVPDAGQVQLDDAWEWDGTDWLETTPADGPPARTEAALAYDYARRHLVLLGGGMGAGAVAVNDTWLAGQLVPARNVAYGLGCGGASGVPALAGFGRAHLGNGSYALDVDAARGGAPMAYVLALGRGGVPLSPVCTFLLDPLTALWNVPAVTSSTGFASLRLPIPPQFKLVGAQLDAQGVVLDGTVPIGIAMTNGLEVTVGM